MCKHALTRLPLISPWAALMSAFWVSDKARLVLCSFSPTKYWTDLKVEIFFYPSRNLQQLASSLPRPICQLKVLFWWCVCVWFDETGCLELCVPSLYKLWLITTMVDHSKRQPPILGNVYVCTRLNWESWDLNWIQTGSQPVIKDFSPSIFNICALRQDVWSFHVDWVLLGFCSAHHHWFKSDKNSNAIQKCWYWKADSLAIGTHLDFPIALRMHVHVITTPDSNLS